MRVAHYLIRGQSGLFYFRLRVPADLRPAFGRAIIKQATGTRCPRAALAVAVALSSADARSFKELRRGDAMTKRTDVDDLLKNLSDGNIHEWKGSVVLPNGAKFENVEIASKAQADWFGQNIEDIGRLPPHLFAAVNAPSASPTAAAPTVSQPATASGITLLEGIRKWVLSIRGKNKQEKTRTAKKAAAEGFEQWKQGTLGPVAVSVRLDSITRTDCSEWFIFLQGSGLTPRTIENKFMYLAGFFDWAMASGHYPKPDNPARGHAAVSKKIKKARAKSHGWQAYTPEQLAIIFNPADYASMESEAARWIPIIALYTGARSNEIAQLELADCYDDQDGVPVLDFNLIGDNKSLKNDASERKTPVHPDLIALGLWERVARLKAAGETKLFPELNFTAQNGPANGPQRAFSRYLDRLKVEARGYGKVGHHSFRDTVIGKMKAARVPRELREEYTGHQLSERQEHSHAYELDFSAHGLAQACHPSLVYGLDLDALRKLLR